MAGDLVIVGRYELGERLGLGGMSTVHLAYDRRLERYVAVKLLAEHLAHDEQFVTRFRREALAAARLVHPNIVQVFDFGLDDTTGRHYIVMERILGQSCAEMLRERGHLPLEEALAIVVQACRGLEYAHRNGVVHRDVKPGNLLRAEDGTVKLADFGIAKALSDESSITQVGSVLGTAAYLAPEQAAGEEAGPPADLYALGVVTYQMVSGRLPYEASSLTELALMQQREKPALLHTVVAGVPAAFGVAVDRALALDPRHRYANADALRQALVEGAQGIGPAEDATQLVEPTAATSMLPRGDTAEQPALSPRAARVPRQGRRPPPAVPVAAPPAAAAARPRRRGRVRRFVTTLLLLGLLGGAAAAAIVLGTQGEQAVRLRDVVSDDARQVIDRLEELVRENTR